MRKLNVLKFKPWITSQEEVVSQDGLLLDTINKIIYNEDKQA